MSLSRSPKLSQIVRITLAAAVAAVMVADTPASAQTKRRRRFTPRRKTKRPGARPTRRPTRRPAKPVIGAKKGKTPPAGPNTVKTNPGTGKAPLASVFAGDDGGAYFVSESKMFGKKSKKKRVVWMGEHPGRKYAHVFRGVRTGNTISGNWICVSKYKSTGSGQLKVRVENNGTLTRLSSTGGFPTKKWTVRTMKSIVHLLPGKRKPAYTTFSLSDLDGAFDDKKGYRYYVRETNSGLYGIAEAPFKKGNQPAAVMAFFLKRTGSKSLSGNVYAVPKGKKKGRSSLKFSVKNNRSLLKTTGIPFGGGPLLPVLSELPDIKIPVPTVMNILNSQMNKVEFLLDTWNGKPEQRSYVRFGSGKKFPFTLPYLQVKIGRLGRPRQTFINDIKSDIINVKSLGGTKARLSILAEENGKELKRRMVGALIKDDKRLADLDVKNLRVDVEFSLVNYGKSISYRVDKVKVHAVIDVRIIPDKIDKWIASKIHPHVEKKIKEVLNKSDYRSLVSNAVDSKVKSLQDYLSKYNLYGYSAAKLAPKEVFISGSNVVIRFRD